MKNKATLLGLMASLLIAAPGFAAIPSTVWHTNDTNFFDMWNRTNLDSTFFWEHATNWGVSNPGTDSAMITTDAAAHPSNWTNLVWKWQSDSSQKNFMIRFTWRMLGTPSGNSGFNVRGFCAAGTIANLCSGASQGYKVAGPQIDLGPTYTGDIWNSAGGGTAGANLGPTAPNSCAVAGATFQDLAMKVQNDTMTTYYYANGFAAGNPIQCTRYNLALSGANYVAATSPGMFALQYETTRASQFKNVQMKNLDAVQGPTSLKSAKQSFTNSKVTGGLRAIEFSIPTTGRYSVQISDLRGVVLRNIQGTGPVVGQKVTLGKAGIFFVRVSSSHETSTKKVFAH